VATFLFGFVAKTEEEWREVGRSKETGEVALFRFVLNNEFSSGHKQASIAGGLEYNGGRASQCKERVCVQ